MVFAVSAQTGRPAPIATPTSLAPKLTAMSSKEDDSGSLKLFTQVSASPTSNSSRGIPVRRSSS
ncbi:hypothetical protein [Lentzea sp. NPDC059081]|uniref:hypothetical protein n=1 Tax=Lentzea sp. NPDC059081 TaxID=3346719 RepID=UPI0036C7A1A9